MTRLPVPGSDDGVWGDLLNEFLAVEHNADGSLRKTARLNTKKLVRTDSNGNLANVVLGTGFIFDGTKLDISFSQRSVTTKSKSYSIKTGDDIILGNAASQALTLSLPTAINKAGRVYTVKRVNSGLNTHNITIQAMKGQAIDGTATYTLTAQYQSIDIVSDGNNWFII